MVDKNVFTQELKKVFTILKEIKVVEKYVKELIDNNNLTEDKVTEFEEKLNQYKRDLDYINENTELLQESLNQMNINLEDLIEYVDSIKDFINQNENTTEIGGSLEVDGSLIVNSNIRTEDMSVTGELSLPSTSNLIFEDGSTFGGEGKIYSHLYKCKYTSWPNGSYIIIHFITTRSSPSTIAQSMMCYVDYSLLKADVIFPATGVIFSEENTTSDIKLIYGISKNGNYFRIHYAYISDGHFKQDYREISTGSLVDISYIFKEV